VLNDAAVSALIIVTKEKYRHRVEMVIHARGNQTLSGLGEGTGWPLAIRQAAQKIEQQAKKLKGKWDSRKRQAAKVVRNRKAHNDQELPVAAGPRIVRATRYAVKPMSVDDAALRLDAVDDAFVVFRNAEDDAVNILYRRKDGNIGLIEPD
jgi:putative sigma-54 modulation protein